MVCESGNTETEIFLSNVKEETSTNFEVDSATATPINHNGTDENGRIWGGTPLTAATFVSPFTAYVYIKALNAAGVLIQECGGVILSTVWVLTAAHCVALATDITVFAGTIADPVNAFTSSSTAEAKIHPNFKLNCLVNDIALLSLDTPLTFSGTVGKAFLSTVKPTTALDNIVFTTLGFGPPDDATVTVPVPVRAVRTVVGMQTLNNASNNAQARASFVDVPSTLNVIDMQNMNRATCNQQTAPIFVLYPSNTGCLSTSTGTKGVCNADPGGPVFYESPTDSTANKRCNICNLAAAAGYTMRISLWIVVLALLAQASSRVSKCLKEDVKKTGNLDAADVTKEYTLEALGADANYTETETFLSNLESTTNFEIHGSATATPINQIHDGTDENGRILGGTALTAATFVTPYTAYAFIRALNTAGVVIQECGGVILSTVWVLTAAHCVALATDINVFAGTIADPVNTATSSSTATALIHPRFRLNYFINDIALLSLDTPLMLSGTVGTALLSTVKPSATLDNIVFTTLGFGPPNDATVTVVVPDPPPQPLRTVLDMLNMINASYNAQARASFVDAKSTLNVVDMQNMNKESCNEQTIGIFLTYPGNTGCLNTATGTKGVCFADEGGPVFYTSPTETTGKIIGINSQVLGCPRQQPSSFTWIYSFIPWIQAETLKKFTWVGWERQRQHFRVKQIWSGTLQTV
ncbi:Hypothetical predicted protein [Cloeon dipterum]|uniref:Peptidase S1 domain-containing protein n=1 Tax=Cloeon dipterum TaxID=197152 RepID=A0A8S1DJ90_9INSE|nr:Hypothetical predicted protein [Cloeon dipterum]